MIKILVDASSDYLPAEAEEKGLILIPITITLGDTVYQDGVNLTRNEFYPMVAGSRDFPKTSQPSPQVFLDCFQQAKKNGDELICILLSSALSGTYQSAVLAREMAEYDNIYLIDSLSATFTIRIMAEYACRLIAKGMEAAAIAKEIERLKSRVKVIAVLDTLEFLKRGGRISRTAAAVGEMANLKPIIAVTPEGAVGVEGKCFGKNKAISHILNSMQSITLDPEFPLYSIYSYGTANCERFEQKLTQAGYSITQRLQIGPVIGTHIGPEAFGLVYVEKA